MWESKFINNKLVVKKIKKPVPLITSGDPEPCLVCPICRTRVTENQPGMVCDRCNAWHHADCLYIDEEEYQELCNSSGEWFCTCCLEVKSNKLSWGNMNGEEEMLLAINNCYDECIKWTKNMFLLPRGKCGTDFIKELTRLVTLFNCKTKWERLSLPLFHIFFPLMLQKPSKTSKAKDHAKYLLQRLEKWKSGDLKSLIVEGKEIQKRLKKAHKKQRESNDKAFCRLMFVGKVGQAMKFINNDDNVVGVHKLTDDIKKILQDKHPAGEDPPTETPEDVLLGDGTDSFVQPVIFEDISAESIKKACMSLHGSGGPTQVDTDAWKHIICSRVYGNVSVELSEALANMAKRLCREQIHPDCLKEFTASRLVPLDKGMDKNGMPGVRPIGVGETIRRIVGKAVMGILKTDIEEVTGPLQTCAGLKSGIEAAVHATRLQWNQESCEAVLQVDAENAFNKLNRKVALHNIKTLCPPLYIFLQNQYQVPSKLIINDGEKQDHIYSEEGCTQGDVASMALYALGVKPLVEKLAKSTDKHKAIQSWYADDSSATGKLEEIKRWWDMLCIEGPKYGYYPKASKTVLILKDISLIPKAKQLFGETEIEFTCDGKRHLGAAIGSENFRTKYVSEKVEKWITDMEELSRIAEDEPQVALSAYTKGISHRWTYLQRTIPDIKELFQPLEDCIRSVFIPALIGRNISDLERQIFSLPVKYGGLGIPNPVQCCEREYTSSQVVTENLTNLIYNQEQDLSNYNREEQLSVLKSLRMAKDKQNQENLDEIMKTADAESKHLKRSLQLNREKGCGSWLTALPLKRFGYALNKVEFRDAIRLRYGWSVPNTPFHCGCGAVNSVDHTLKCMKGGYVAMRHNAMRDLNAEFQREVCRDVVTEPQLIPLNNEIVNGTQAERAAADVSSRGMWSTFERTFFDVQVIHPNCPSYIDTPVEKLYERAEKKKMAKYNSRILQVEKGTFTPLIYSTFGGCGPVADRYHKRLAKLISWKRNEDYAKVVSHMRIKFRFAILRSTLVALRGERGKKTRNVAAVSSTSFNLIPSAMSYECP
jgi:hypothetical protein